MATGFRLTKAEMEAKIKKYVAAGDTESADELRAAIKAGKFLKEDAHGRREIEREANNDQKERKQALRDIERYKSNIASLPKQIEREKAGQNRSAEVSHMESTLKLAKSNLAHLKKEWAGTDVAKACGGTNEGTNNISRSLLVLESGVDEVLLEGFLGDSARQIWEMALTKLGVDKANVAKGLTNIFATLSDMGSNIKEIVAKYTNAESVANFIKGQKSLTKVLSGVHR
jgi:hypothetical protein